MSHLPFFVFYAACSIKNKKPLDSRGYHKLLTGLEPVIY